MLPDVLAAIDLATAGVVVTLVATGAAAVKALTLLGPDRTEKLMENFERKIVASEGEAIIWKRRAESAEARSEELEQELDDIRKDRP